MIRNYLKKLLLRLLQPFIRLEQRLKADLSALEHKFTKEKPHDAAPPPAT